MDPIDRTSMQREQNICRIFAAKILVYQGLTELA